MYECDGLKREFVSLASEVEDEFENEFEEDLMSGMESCDIDA